MFTRCCVPDAPLDAPARQAASFYFYPDDVVALHQQLTARGHPAGKLRVTFYHMKEFELIDPDGYQLIFGQDTGEAPSECS